MPRKESVDERWYQTERRTVEGEWIMWEMFPYDHDSGMAQSRLTARSRAIKVAKDCNAKHGFPVRVVHIQQTFRKEVT